MHEGEHKLKGENPNGVMPRRMETPPVKEITTTVGKSGTGAHCFVPKDWIGKRVKVILLDD